MAPVLSICGFTALVAIIIYRYIVVPAFISPLSKLPTAHPLCAVTSIWFSRQRKKQRELKTLYAAHQKHGPLIRLGPDEVSVVSREGLRQIYTAGLEKTSFYTDLKSFGVPNLVSMLDHGSHSTQKRMITSLYSNSNIQHSQDVEELSKKIIFDRFLPMLKDSAKKGESMDVLKLFQWTNIDFMSAFSFGTVNYTDFLADEHRRDLYFSEWEVIRNGDDFSGKDVMEGVVMEMCEAVTSASSRGEIKSGTNALSFLKLYSQISEAAKAEGSIVSEKDIIRRCASEMLDHLIAAHETGGTTLTYAAWRLSRDEALQSALRSELLTLQPQASLTGGRTLPPPASIERLPLLDAIVKETLRLHAPVPCRQPRVVPAGGLHLHGYYIPPDTTVSSNAYCLHRNETVFPMPSTFTPHRWMPTGGTPEAEMGPSAEEMKRWFWAFGSGGRMCIGSNLALQISKLILAAVYTNFETVVIDDTGIEQSDSYIASPIGNKLILAFRSIDGTST